MGMFTLASRVLGYVRDALYAARFGAGWVADAYFVAFRIPNLLRDLVGEGALSAAIIPSVSRAFANRGARDAHRLVSALLTWGCIGGAALVAVGVLAAPVIVSVMAPGFAVSPQKFGLTVSLTRWLFPFIVFISLAAVVMGWLNSRERFGPSAFAPVALNLCVILAAVVLCPLFGVPPEKQIYGWVLGMLLGGLAQWLVQVPAARELGFRFGWRLWHAGMRSIGALMVPALAGFSFTQVHLLVNTILASLLPEGSVAHLYYGNRLMQLPLGVFGVALSTASYPVVVRALAAGQPGEASAALNWALRLAAFAVLPASAGLIALAPQINGLLFRFGRFTAEDAAVTASVSVAYAVGIIGHALMRVLTPSFYAAGRPYVPVALAGVGVLANALLSSVLMLRLGVVGLPIATTLVTLASALWLGVRLRAILPGVGGRGVLGTFARSAVAAAIMGAAVWAAARWGGSWLIEAGAGVKTQEALLTAGGIAFGLVVFATLAWIMRIKEFKELIQALRKRSE